MKFPPFLIKIAAFLAAILLTLGIVLLVSKGMAWIFSYIGAFGVTRPAQSLPIVGAIVLGFVVVLRFYLRRRAKQARQKKKKTT
jgi:FtsH-binding integral membrane protein